MAPSMPCRTRIWFSSRPPAPVPPARRGGPSIAGLNVMLFSDNVPLESERALKERAHSLGLLVMGPDCGTAYVAGTPLAFANVVPVVVSG